MNLMKIELLLAMLHLLATILMNFALFEFSCIFNGKLTRKIVLMNITSKIEILSLIINFEPFLIIILNEFYEEERSTTELI